MKRRSLAVLLLLAAATISAATYPYTASDGHAHYLPTTAKTVASTPTSGVAVPSDANAAVLVVSVAGIRYWSDGATPTTSAGVPLAAGTIVVFSETQLPILRSWKFIEDAAGAEVDIVYTSRVRH